MLCLPLGIVNETCGLKMQKNQGVVITNNHAFFVEPKNIYHKVTKDKFINLFSCLGVLVAMKTVEQCYGSKSF
jgi:hypothetical protein